MAQSVISQVMDETLQSPNLRKPLYKKLATHFDGKCILLFYTSFYHPVIIDDGDADLIESVIQGCDLSKGLVLVLNSPGGSGLAAERIVNVLRSYSTKGFEVVIPRAAKSAATMVAMGATGLYMSKTSELGPVDPQIVQRQGDRSQVLPAYVIIDAYKELMQDAIGTQGNLDPFLLQLGRYDPGFVKDLEREMDLSRQIALNVLGNGMLSGKTEDEITDLIAKFLDPRQTASHGRALLADDAIASALKVTKVGLTSPLWKDLWALHVRADHSTRTNCLKLVETSNQEFVVPA